MLPTAWSARSNTSLPSEVITFVMYGPIGNPFFLAALLSKPITSARGVVSFSSNNGCHVFPTT